MKFLKRLATGDIALWRVFWLLGLPLSLIWDVTLLCMAMGWGHEQPVATIIIIALFVLASFALPLVAWGAWRSASNYPRKAWWHTLLAWSAKACAAFLGLIGVLSIIGLIYLGQGFIEALLSGAL
jgi:hypothetical protein